MDHSDKLIKLPRPSMLAPIGVLLLACAAAAQTFYVPADYFPAQFEFRDLEKVEAEERAESRAEVEKLRDGPVMAEAGALSWVRRIYALAGGGRLSIEIATLDDERGAYSLLTCIPGPPVSPGPPGDFRAASAGLIAFAQSTYWARVESAEAGDLVRRVAASVGNRIARHANSAPSLLGHMPKAGLDSSTLKYLLGPAALKACARPISGAYPEFAAPLEIAQAAYSFEGQNGFLSLLGFPTSQMAEDYFDTGLVLLAGATDTGGRIFSRRAGPLIAILEGNFDSGRADRVLESLEYTYSVKWIYDKNKNAAASILGLPYGVMSTVVRSIVLVSLLCLLSIVAGACLAFFRIALRSYAPNNILDRPERTELIRLKIDEN